MDGTFASEDVRLLAAASAGDEMAFARIVTAYDGDMRRVAYLVSGDVETAHDAVQSAWSIAWRKLDGLRDPDRLRPWLVSIAANEARQMLRRQRRRRVVEVPVEELVDPGGGPAAPGGVGPGPDGMLDLLAAVARLHPDDRAIVAMRYALGMTSMEIGRELHMRPGSVRSRLARALVRLREELHDA